MSVSDLLHFSQEDGTPDSRYVAEISDFIFDLDGTLIDSAPAILRCLKRTLQSAGYTPQVPLQHQLIGPPLTETLSHLTGLTDQTALLRLADDFKSLYDASEILQTRAFPGIEAMLEALVLQGMRLHLTTNKRMKPTRILLDTLGWNSYFASIYTLDMVIPHFANKSEALRQQLKDLQIAQFSALYIGDTPADGNAAAANKLRFAAATWGYGGFAALQNLAFGIPLASPSSLVDLCRAWRA